MRPVEPLTKQQIKTLRLLGKRSERHAQGRFIIEGERAVRQILFNDRLDVISIIMDQSRTDIAAFITESGTQKDLIPVFTVSSSMFHQLSDTKSSQGVLAVCSLPEPADSASLLAGEGLLLAADRIQDPGNMGTLIRTAVWFGISGLVLSPGSVDLFHPKVVRSTAGATGELPWVESEVTGFLKKAEKAGWRVLLLDASPGASSYQDIAATGKDILVVGNEANGIAENLQNEGYTTVQIERGSLSSGTAEKERSTGVESLNVSIAAAIAMAHFTITPSG